MSTKDIATTFLKLVSSGKVREAYKKYVYSDFRHHNAYFKGDRESLLKAMEEAYAKTPNKLFEVQHVLEDGDLVAVHSHVQQESGIDIAVVHIFRFEGEKIAELWDVGLVVPKDSPNKNGIF